MFLKPTNKLQVQREALVEAMATENHALWRMAAWWRKRQTVHSPSNMFRQMMREHDRIFEILLLN